MCAVILERTNDNEFMLRLCVDINYSIEENTEQRWSSLQKTRRAKLLVTAIVPLCTLVMLFKKSMT